MSKKLLIIEDDSSLNQMLQFHFEENGFDVAPALNCGEGLELLRQNAYDLILLDQQLPDVTGLDQNAYDLILLDQQLPDGTGLDLLQQIREREPEQAMVMMTGEHDLELAIEAIKQGAADFVHKPIKTEALQIVVDRVLENRRLAREVAALQPADDEPEKQRELIGRSDAMLQVSKEIALCAASGATVLISGESGTGKEVVARLIHLHSGRNGPFVAVNCAAIVDSLLESELFGHEKGAFTGADSRKQGKFELAQDGTLFLDEIGELAPQLQAKILRALQEQVFERVGGTQLISTNARIISATHRDLFREAERGRFREDLAYRLKVISIQLPPLRERREDIPLLTEALIRKIANKIHKQPLQPTPATLAALRAHHWPGNVRELENVLTQALVQARNNALTPDLLTLPGGSAPPAVEEADRAAPAAAASNPLRTLDEVEAEHIQLVLNHTGGHKGKSCELLGISRPALDRKIKKYSLTLP